MENILHVLEQLPWKNKNEMLAVKGNFVEKRIKQKTKVALAGEVIKEAYFIQKGCLRLYYEKDETEISAYFFTENMYTGACESFLTQKPSRHYIEAVENTVAFSVTHKQLQELFNKYPAVSDLFRQIMEERFESIHHLFTSQILDSPEERYRKLVAQAPKLINRIPQHQIATYLGITPVSLSRIRNRMKRKK